MNTMKFDSKIAANRSAITAHEAEIKELEEKSRNIVKYLGKLSTDADHLSRFSAHASNLIQSLSDSHGSGASVSPSFFSDLRDVACGDGNSRVKGSLNMSRSKAEKKHEEIKRRIEELKRAIQQCNSNINTIKAQKADYISKEKAKKAEKSHT